MLAVSFLMEASAVLKQTEHSRAQPTRLYCGTRRLATTTLRDLSLHINTVRAFYQIILGSGATFFLLKSVKINGSRTRHCPKIISLSSIHLWLGGKLKVSI